MKIIGPMSGVGSRLRPFTYSKPKGFLKVAGKRIIDHILDLFPSDATKKSDLLLITGAQSRSIKEYLTESYSKTFNISFEIQEPKGYNGDIPYYGGLGEAVYLSKNWYESKISSYESKNPDDYAIIFLSDMVPIAGFNDIFDVLCSKAKKNPNMDNMADEFKDDDEGVKKKTQNTNNCVITDADGVLAVMRVPKERASSYGIIELDKKTGFIKNMVEKPNQFISDLAIAGIYAFKPSAMKKLYEFLSVEVKNHKDVKGEAQLTPALQKLVQDGFKIVPAECSKGILDFGKADTLLEGNRFLLLSQDNVIGGPVEKVVDSSLVSPSYIGKNVEIKNCVIGPFVSIGDNTHLTDCIISNCVIGDDCFLERIITKFSIIGDSVAMNDLIKDNLIIGDQSTIRSVK